jgi:hypothetical protein
MPKSGARKCSGPKRGSGQYGGEPTKLLRVPGSRIEDVRKFLRNGHIHPTSPLISMGNLPVHVPTEDKH